ncbi:MAG TPA: NDP-sugar synthase [Gaiellaceae bacterium]|nr:NDP-sugar synthase [Gaiellaceae bacterium]
MEAIILAGGRAERLGQAALNRPKALVEIAGKPLAAYQLVLLGRAGVERVVIACAAGQEALFESELAGFGPEVAAVGEPEPLGRGGGLRFAARARREEGDVLALNGDELLALDLAALLARQRETGAAATVAVTRPRSPFGVVELGDDDTVAGFREADLLPQWVSCGVYALGEAALAALPERGDHERTTFPALAAQGRLRAFRYEGLWLTVNTPKELRAADEHVRAHPEWLDVGQSAGV